MCLFFARRSFLLLSSHRSGTIRPVSGAPVGQQIWFRLHQLPEAPTTSASLTIAPTQCLVETQTRSGGFNWDLLSQTYPEAILEAISSRKPVLTEAYMLPNISDPENVAEYEAWKEWFRNMIHPNDVSPDIC